MDLTEPVTEIEKGELVRILVSGGCTRESDIARRVLFQSDRMADALHRIIEVAQRSGDCRAVVRMANRALGRTSSGRDA